MRIPSFLFRINPIYSRDSIFFKYLITTIATLITVYLVIVSFRKLSLFPPTNVHFDIVRKADDYELKEWITSL